VVESRNPSARVALTYSPHKNRQDIRMVITAAHITPLVALIAGILILLVPRLLNYVVAIYLIIVGLTGLNGIYHFFH
jgi:cobalamin synthase